MYDFSRISSIVFSVGRVSPNGVQLLGTAFLTDRKGVFATVAHVSGHDDTNLVIAFKPITSISDYQDTSDNSVQLFPVKIYAYDPIHDLCLLKSDHEITSNVVVGNADDVRVGENVAIFGYPHADQGRMVLTQQLTEIGAKILVTTGGIKSKHVVLNIQSRPGQSGSPIMNLQNGKLVAVLVGSYAPGGGGGISLGGVDPHTLHQTTHAISAEYLERMF